MTMNRDYRSKLFTEVQAEKTIPAITGPRISREAFERFEARINADRDVGIIDRMEHRRIWAGLSQAMQGPPPIPGHDQF